jgi:hypothetical protein
VPRLLEHRSDVFDPNRDDLLLDEHDLGHAIQRKMDVASRSASEVSGMGVLRIGSAAIIQSPQPLTLTLSSSAGERVTVRTVLKVPITQ